MPGPKAHQKVYVTCLEFADKAAFRLVPAANDSTVHVQHGA